MRLNAGQRALIGLVGLVTFAAALLLKVEHEPWQGFAIVFGIAFVLLLTAREEKP